MSRAGAAFGLAAALGAAGLVSVAPGRAGAADGARATARTAAAPVAAAAPSAAAPSARHDYLLACAGCHTLDGTGSVRVPTLVGVDRLLARPGGRDYLMRVPGVAQAPLSDARLAALLNWMLARFGAAAPSPPFTGAEVGRARRSPLLDPRGARAALDRPAAERPD